MPQRPILCYEPSETHTVTAAIDFEQAFTPSKEKPPLLRDAAIGVLRAQFVKSDTTAHPLIFAVVLKLEKIEHGVDNKAGVAADLMTWSLRVWPPRAQAFLPMMVVETKQRAPSGILSKLKEMLEELAKTTVIYKGATIVGWGKLCLSDQGQIQSYTDTFWTSGFTPARNDGTNFWERWSDRLEAAKVWLARHLGEPYLDPWEDTAVAIEIDKIVDAGMGLVVRHLADEIINVQTVRMALRRDGYMIPSSGLTHMIEAPPNWPKRRDMRTVFVARPDLLMNED